MKKHIALIAIASLLALPAFAAENADVAADTKSVNNFLKKCSVSADLVYGIATASESFGGIDMSGLDVRFNYHMTKEHEFSVGLLTMSGEKEDITPGVDLSRSEASILLGYRYNYAISEKFGLFAGARLGVSAVSYLLDEGKTLGWRTTSTASNICFGYGVEIGASFAINDHWSLNCGYEYFGDTQNVGRGDAKFRDQQYHTFFIGGAYSF